jgi:hypothetical protein
MSKLTSTRVATVPDVQRMSKAFERPGIDTRVWACRAVVTKIVIDRDHGVLLDVTLLPDETPETAKLAPMYAGAGFGFYLPVRVDDEVLVVAPMGSPDNGLEAYPRVWDGADPPPRDVVDNPEDVLLHIRPGKNLRIVTEGAGKVVIDPRDTGVVELGGESLNALVDGVVHGTGVDPFTGSTYAVLGNTSANVLAKK